MNKLVIFGSALTVALTAFGQGEINVNNRGLAGSPIVRDSGGAALVGTSFVAQIVYGSSADSLNATLGAVMPFRAATTTSPGTWNPLAVDGVATGVRTLQGFDVGSTVQLQVRVWDSAVFTDWAAASAALAAGQHSVATQAGSSAVFSYTVPASTNPIKDMTNFQGFTLTAIPVVPEPTTIALGALGAAALLWRRRK